MIENAILPCKTAPSKANVKTNRIRSTKTTDLSQRTGFCTTVF